MFLHLDHGNSSGGVDGMVKTRVPTDLNEHVMLLLVSSTSRRFANV